MQWGSRIEFLEKVERETGETPTALLNRKVPDQWTLSYWSAFQDLTGSRTWSQSGPSQIPYMSKIVWLNENYVTDPDDRKDILLI